MGGLGEIDKGGIGGTDKGGMGGANIEARIEVDGINKGEVGGVDIKADKKASAVASASIDSSTDSDGDGRATNQRAGLKSVTIAALAAADNAEDSNIAVAEGLLSSAATSTFDKFFSAFATLANTTLERETNVCESTPFGFICQ